MVSKTTMHIVIGVMLLFLGSILTFGFLLSLPGGGNQASASAVEENNVSGNTKSVDSSTPTIFNYCTWQAEFTTQIGKYNTAPAGKKYAVVTLKINNTGDQTYSTNPNYWHLKIGDIYYQYDIAIYDGSLHHLTADIGPGGKITVGMPYLVDRNLSISDMDMYYNGPGSDGVIGSNEGIKPVDSSTPNIFNYCTLQGEFTTQIGEYNTAPAGKKYAVVTLKINNTGDQTYSTNPNYWHLKIGDIYYQYDAATYDDSLHHLTADIGPGGKIIVGMAYLVDRNLSISDMEMYYDGPGSDGIIGSTYSVITDKNTNSNPVEPLLPVADFTANPLIGASPLPVQFTDHSQNEESRVWDFGDGTNSTDLNPAHTYSTVGNYTAKLTVNNKNGTNSNVTTITVLGSLPVYPVPNFNANPTSGIAPLTVYFTDSSQNAAAWSWNFGDGTTSSEQNPTHTYSAEGTYTVNLIVNNTIGTSPQTATATITVQSSSSEGSSGGSSHSSGGGGAGGSPEPQSNVEAKELSQTFIASGKAVKFNFPRCTTPVVYVSFDSKKTAGKTTTISEMLRGKSTLVSGLPSDETYKHLNIWVGNGGFATSKNIENAVICFKIEKSWIQDKKIDQSSITLNRYNDKKWNQLPTSLFSEDDKYLYFTAQTPGFSPFAITGKTTATDKIQSVTETKTQPATVTKTGSTAANIEQTPEQNQSSNTSGKGSTKAPGFEIAFSIVSLLGLFLYKRR
jgi:PGF-pre-PGF domain-containing protein